MKLDCDNMSASVKKYAVDRGYCVADGQASQQKDTVYGDCGASWIYIWPWGSAGEADVYYGFRSSKGTVVYRYLNGYWESTSRLGGSWPDRGYMASTSLDRWRNINAGQGTMYTTIGGSVTLWWGGSCHLLNPRDNAYVG